MRAVQLPDRLRSFRYDWSAAFWFAVSYLGTIFGIYPVIFVWLVITRQGAQMDPVYAIVAPGLLGLTIFAVATYRLVVGDPWRRFPTTMVTLYLLQLAGVGAIAVINLLRAPQAAADALLSLVGPLTFGLVQVTKLAPFTLTWPDVWVPAGAMLGFALARRKLAAEGRAAGAAADVHLRPLRLPKLHEIDGSGRAE